MARQGRVAEGAPASAYRLFAGFFMVRLAARRLICRQQAWQTRRHFLTPGAVAVAAGVFSVRSRADRALAARVGCGCCLSGPPCHWRIAPAGPALRSEPTAECQTANARRGGAASPEGAGWRVVIGFGSPAGRRTPRGPLVSKRQTGALTALHASSATGQAKAAPSR